MHKDIIFTPSSYSMFIGNSFCIFFSFVVLWCIVMCSFSRQGAKCPYTASQSCFRSACRIRVRVLYVCQFSSLLCPLHDSWWPFLRKVCICIHHIHLQSPSEPCLFIHAFCTGASVYLPLLTHLVRSSWWLAFKVWSNLPWNSYFMSIQLNYISNHYRQIRNVLIFEFTFQ